MARIHSKTLLNTSWTATSPREREKHFRVHSVIEKSGSHIVAVRMQALISGNIYCVEIQKLEDECVWQRGWH